MTIADSPPCRVRALRRRTTIMLDPGLARRAQEAVRAASVSDAIEAALRRTVEADDMADPSDWHAAILTRTGRSGEGLVAELRAEERW